MQQHAPYDSVRIFFLKQKTAYEMLISDWSSDVCSSDLHAVRRLRAQRRMREPAERAEPVVDRHHHNAAFGQRAAVIDRIAARPAGQRAAESGRASCRERVCQYVYISVVAVALKKTISSNTNRRTVNHYLRHQPNQ